MYHFFLRLFFQFVSLIPVFLCNCLLMYFCLLFFFCFIFTFFSLLFFWFVTYVCKSPNHGGNKDIYIYIKRLYTCVYIRKQAMYMYCFYSICYHIFMLSVLRFDMLESIGRNKRICVYCWFLRVNQCLWNIVQTSASV